MYKYYVNKNAQSNGDHEVHLEGCSHMPDKKNCEYVGEFLKCHPAVMKAKKLYPSANGCFYCSKECHTS